MEPKPEYMGMPQELREKYRCTVGKELLVCDECGLLFCGDPKIGNKVPYSDSSIYRCYGCGIGGLR
jgi:hypothetical protein